MRLFSREQRAALYAASGGRCERCGSPIEDGFHADHNVSYSRGGLTDRKSKLDNIQVERAPTGNSKQAAIRRLRKQRPDLLKLVKSGQLSANAAMKRAGFRRERTGLSLLKWAWKKATKEERNQFLDEVSPRWRE